MSQSSQAPHATVRCVWKRASEGKYAGSKDLGATLTVNTGAFAKSAYRAVVMEIRFITDIADLEPLNLAHKGSSTEEDVLTPAFFFSGG